MPELPTDIQFALDEIKRRLAQAGIPTGEFDKYKQKVVEQLNQANNSSEAKRP